MGRSKAIYKVGEKSRQKIRERIRKKNGRKLGIKTGKKIREKIGTLKGRKSKEPEKIKQKIGNKTPNTRLDCPASCTCWRRGLHLSIKHLQPTDYSCPEVAEPKARWLHEKTKQESWQ